MNKWALIGNFLRKHKLRSSVVIVASVLGGLLAVVIPVSIGLYYELVFNFSTHRSQILSLLPEAWTATVPAFLVFLFVLVMLRLFLMFIERFHSAVLGELFSQSLRERMFLHQTRAYMSYYDERGTGKYLLRYSTDLKSIQDFLTAGVFQFIGDISLLLLSFAAMVLLDTRIAMITLGGVLITIGVIHILNRHLYRTSEKRRDIRSRLISFVSKRLAGMLSLKMLNREGVEVAQFTERSLKLLEAGKAFQLVQAAIASLIPALSYVVLIVVLWYVFDASGKGGEVQKDGVFSFALLFITTLPILRRTLRAESIWKIGSISFRKLINVFQQQTEVPRGEDKIAIKGDIVFDSVTFSYGDKVIFSDLSFRVPWRKTSFMRTSPGMGRTTILKILTRVYSEHSGAVRYGDIDSTDLDPWNIRRALAIVSESLPLLGKTVFEAISYGRQPDRKKKAAALLEHLQSGESRDIARMDIDQPIGEMGSALSRAQKMCLIYARALLSGKPYLFIEDDFLWASKRMQRNIARILEEMRGKKTILWMSSNRACIPVEFDATVQVTAGN